MFGPLLVLTVFSQRIIPINQIRAQTASNGMLPHQDVK